MAGELVLRFVLGGLIVCAFAVLGEVFRPRTFAGVFGAAPSVALATLGITFANKPAAYAAQEGEAMLAGAAAMIAYCLVVAWRYRRSGRRPILEATAPWLLWLGVAFGLWGAFLR